MRTLVSPKVGLVMGGGVLLVALFAWSRAAQVSRAPREQIGGSDISGGVSGPSGPEAGVWVIAETSELPTTFRKIVVTDDRGRYVVPDLPKATYKLWVRGYGLVDSAPIQAAPGKVVNLMAVVAPNPRAAAEYYPANYWNSLLRVPPKSDFPGTGAKGNGISEELKTQAAWIDNTKQGCNQCHQMGNKVTRETPSRYEGSSSLKAWDLAMHIGQRGLLMNNKMDVFGRERGLAMYADWSDRIAAGELPPPPPRPQGAERSVVLTMWEWSVPASYVHDMVSTDKRKPTLNANGPVYGVSNSHGTLVIADPIANTTTEISVPVREPTTPPNFSLSLSQPSPYWGSAIIWTDPANPHTPMIDGKGRVWMTQRIRAATDQPDFCKTGSSHPSAKNFPLNQSGGRQLSFYDPKTEKFTLIDTCYGAHHLMFAEDKDDTLWINTPGAEVVVWFKTRVFDQTADAQAAQGWCPAILDTNGDGKIGPYTQPNEPADATKDRRVEISAYGIIPSPVDGSIWLASTDSLPGRIFRLELGANPPATCKTEVYEPPFDNPKAPEKHGYGPRGIDIDRSTGVIWTGLSGSGHTASFDRRNCAVLNGPTATGQHCPEGWTLYPAPGPKMKGVTDPVSADYHGYNMVDQFNTLGLGANIPITVGSGSDSLMALQPDGTWLVMRVPYPIGFSTKGLDGRIDDPNGGWKGRGLWSTYSSNTMWHVEGGKYRRSAVVHFQLRPEPLAR